MAEEMHRNDSAQYRNVSTPMAMARLLQMFTDGEILTNELQAYLWSLMAKTPTGAKRLRGSPRSRFAYGKRIAEPIEIRTTPPFRSAVTHDT